MLKPREFLVNGLLDVASNIYRALETGGSGTQWRSGRAVQVDPIKIRVESAYGVSA